LANGLSQKQLALRAGSTQAAISRLERDEISPTYDTLLRLLAVMGEEPEISVRRIPGDHDRARVTALRARSPEDRLTQAIGWNRLAGEVAQAGQRARRNPPRRRVDS
jgi:transcriptional regulator with XRE-family HTH domain